MMSLPQPHTIRPKVKPQCVIIHGPTRAVPVLCCPVSNMATSSSKYSNLARPVRLRVETFANDPLHSAAYLSGLDNYLSAESPTQNQADGSPSLPQSKVECPFIYCYDLSKTGSHVPTIHHNVVDYSSSVTTPVKGSELIFITGFPSRRWLNAVLNHYPVDYQYLHSHLDFQPGAQRDWYIKPSVPSRRQHCVRLLIPSILFFETETRRIPVKELHDARNSCRAQIKQKAKNLFGGSSVHPGQSIVRQVNIHSGDMMVLEQAVSITVIEAADSFKGASSDTYGYVQTFRCTVLIVISHCVV